MAHSTGRKHLDQLLADFEREQVYMAGSDRSRLVSAWRNCTADDGYCHGVAEALVEFCDEHGITASVSDDEHALDHIGAQEAFACHADELGYQDRMIQGWGPHTVAIIKDGNDLYSVDFTASQFGYTEFPLVQRWGQHGWQRDFLRPVLSHDEMPDQPSVTESRSLDL